MRGRILILVILVGFGSLAGAASLEDEIRDINESILTGEDLDVLPAETFSKDIITLFYETREYRPAWQDKATARQVLDLFAASGEHGLRPADYHYSELLGLLAEWERQAIKSNRTRARFDILLTDAMLLYARHLLQGKVNPGPLEYSWNYSRREFLPEDVVAGVSRAIDEGSVLDTLAELAPDTWFYRQLQSNLSLYRGLQQRGPFVPIPTDRVLREGDSNDNVAALRQRLLELEFLQQPGAEPRLFDAALEEAVRRFQDMHGLSDDGVVGAASFAALNTTHGQRIDQIRINMDRLRWVQQDLSDRLIVVNIAGFELFLVENDRIAWSTDVMVGKVTTQTPMFRARIKYLVFNPTWTVPRSIIRRSLFGKFSSDPGYIEEHHYKLYDRDGDEVTPANLDWSALGPNNFPYRVVQQPGPDNALGRVKFMFPNKHAIYLHDTSHRELFERTARAFSAGCIRVQQPLDLAEILLGDEEAWGMGQIEAVVADGGSRVVHLGEPVDVLLMYWSASPTQSGRLRFHPDVYGRDPGVLKRLNGPPLDPG